MPCFDLEGACLAFSCDPSHLAWHSRAVLVGGGVSRVLVPRILVRCGGRVVSRWRVAQVGGCLPRMLVRSLASAGRVSRILVREIAREWESLAQEWEGACLV